MTRRTERISELLREELSDLVARTIKDPRLAQVVSLVHVETSVDLRHAKVFVSVLGSPEEKQATMAGLDSASGFLQRELMKRLSLRHVPQLHFVLDESLEEADRLLRLMDRVRRQDREAHPGPETPPGERPDE